MADLSNTGLDINAILTYLGAAVGTAVAAFAIRMGWKSGAKEVEAPKSAVELKAALVDSSSIQLLAQSIEGVGVYVMQLNKTNSDKGEGLIRAVDRLIESIENQTNEVREMNREVRELTREVSKRS